MLYGKLFRMLPKGGEDTKGNFEVSPSFREAGALWRRPAPLLRLPSPANHQTLYSVSQSPIIRELR